MMGISLVSLLVSWTALTTSATARPDVVPQPRFHLGSESGSAWTASQFSPDGERIWSRRLNAWNVETGQLTDTEKMKDVVEGDFLTAIDFSDDGSMLLGAHADSRRIVIWDVRSQQVLRSIRPRDSRPETVAFLGKGKRYGIWYPDPPALVIASAESNRVERVVSLDDMGFRGVFSPDGHYFALCVPEKGGVVLWDIDKGRAKHLLQHRGPLSVAFDPEMRRIATGGKDNTARVWDITSGKELACLKGHGTGTVMLPVAVYSLAFDAQGKHLVSGGHDGRAKVWNVAKGQVVFEGAIASKPIIMTVAFSPDSRLLAAGYTGAGEKEGVCEGLCIWGLPSSLRGQEKNGSGHKSSDETGHKEPSETENGAKEVQDDQSLLPSSGLAE